MSEYMWNPWHGCHRISPGCAHCYVYIQDERYERDSSVVTKVKTKFSMPIQKDRRGNYKIPAGKTVATCFTSDFFVEEADAWRLDAWDMIRRRPDLEFFIPTKRIERFMECIPLDWGDGWDNVIIAVTAENQDMADRRLPLFLQLPIRKRAVLVAPILEDVELERYLLHGGIASVSVGGESYADARECRFEWVEHIKEQCDRQQVRFDFHQTGGNFVYRGRRYRIPHRLEYEQAKKAFRET